MTFTAQDHAQSVKLRHICHFASAGREYTELLIAHLERSSSETVFKVGDRALIRWYVLTAKLAAEISLSMPQPCLSGTCSYDLPSTTDATSSGSIQITAGAHTAIGDITTAAGWQILGCDSSAISQDIRLVCMGAEYDSMCQHLYAGHGAVDTIVRLPESCGKGPFARIARAWVPTDQSIPSSIAARIARRQEDAQPQVKALRFDTDFSSVNDTNTGPVALMVKAINVPGLNDLISGNTSDSSAAIASQRRSRLNRRQSLASFKNFVVNAANAISDVVSNANSFGIDKSRALPAIDFNKQATLFEQSLDCPPVSAKISVDVNAKAHAVVTLGVAAAGTIVPPKISLTADLNGELDITADLSGAISSGNIKLFEAGIPGFDFPGILSIGPTFQVNANAKATLDMNVDMTVGINYHIDNAQLFFPPNGQQGGGSFQLGNTPLKLSADTKAAATGTVEAHLVPSINLGLSALGVVQATVNLDLDASATMQLKVEANAGAGATVAQKRANGGIDFSDDESDDAGDSELDDSDNDSDSGDTVDGPGDAANSSSQDDSDDATSSDDSDPSDSSSANDDDDAFGEDLEDDDNPTDSLDDASLVDDDDEADSSDTPQADDIGDSDDTLADDDSESHLSDAWSEVQNADVDDSADTANFGAEDDSTDGLGNDDEDSSLDDNSFSNSTSIDSPADTDRNDDADALTSSVVAATDGLPSANSTAADSSRSSDNNTDLAAAQSRVSTNTDASFGGSFTVSAGLALNAGATGSFFGLFDKSTKVSLFQKNFDLLSKSFGSDNARRSNVLRRWTPRVARADRLPLQARGLQCRKAENTPQKLADASIPAKSLQ
ncbi:hypothetical protein MIND_01237300 [Mycena indigotica]|uniref:DUF7223 domain-containing protein n=1 Tax=Mycena indigotica TaxID=2126181 RepID=A0A8H6S4W7_9AGAR|nr:uncharacterized protein MIND_01237300 [Mycena indigotica]KAF7292106.1 hypothetical protein MIND_01237300 [Mycena indigotica]